MICRLNPDISGQTVNGWMRVPELRPGLLFCATGIVEPVAYVVNTDGLVV